METDESGELTFSDREKMLEETSADTTNAGAELSLHFSQGPRMAGSTGALAPPGVPGDGGVEGEAGGKGP